MKVKQRKTETELHRYAEDIGLPATSEIKTLMQDRSNWHAMARGNST
jgi:hypothetical protein